MEKEIIIDNSRIYYRIIGSGQPVVLLHGFGEDGEIWKNQIEFLKDSFQLIIPDLPGSGKSEMINDMSIEGMAEVVKKILEAEHFLETGVALIGHSMGGYIGLAFAEKYDSLLNSFGLFHSTAYSDGEEKKLTRRKGIEFIEQYGAFEFLKTATPNLFSAKTKDERPILIDEQISGLHNFSSLALVSYTNAMMNRPDRRDILKKMNVPVLFVIGEHDNAVSPQDSLQQTHLPEKSYIHILTESGHMGMLEEAEKCNGLLKCFLNSELTSLA